MGQHSDGLICLVFLQNSTAPYDLTLWETYDREIRDSLATWQGRHLTINYCCLTFSSPSAVWAQNDIPAAQNPTVLHGAKALKCLTISSQDSSFSSQSRMSLEGWEPLSVHDFVTMKRSTDISDMQAASHGMTSRSSWSKVSWPCQELAHTHIAMVVHRAASPQLPTLVGLTVLSSSQGLQMHLRRFSDHDLADVVCSSCRSRESQLDD